MQIYSISTGSFCQVYRVTDEALIAETAVWPNFFLMNIFFALKGSKLFIIISHLFNTQSEQLNIRITHSHRYNSADLQIANKTIIEAFKTL